MVLKTIRNGKFFPLHGQFKNFWMEQKQKVVFIASTLVSIKKEVIENYRSIKWHWHSCYCWKNKTFRINKNFAKHLLYFVQVSEKEFVQQKYNLHSNINNNNKKF